MGLAFLEEAAAGAPSITDVLLYRRQQSLLTGDAASACAWTNPHYDLGIRTGKGDEVSETATPAQHRRSSLAAVSPLPGVAIPVMLGWLLGQASGNEIVFALPLPPLAFRILSLAVRLELPVEEVKLDAADVSLQHPEYTRSEWCAHMQEELRASLLVSPAGAKASADDTHFSGSPAVARRHFQRLKSQLSDTLVSMSLNVQHSDAASRAFWAAVLQGMSQTPLTRSPVFAQCCARTLREVLCGPYDHPDADFSFKQSFVLLTNLNAPMNAYRAYIRKCVMGVLDEEFSVAEKRLLLRFITGHSLRTDPVQAEVICVDVQHTFASAPDTQAAQRGTVQLAMPQNAEKDKAPPSHPPVTRVAVDTTLQLLPIGRPSDNTLLIPNYFEALLMGTYREEVLGADFAWLARGAGKGAEAAAEAAAVPTDMKEPVVLEESDFQFAWAGLAAAQQETLKRRFRDLLVHRLRAALYAFLVSRDDSIEASWELAEKLGLGASPTLLNETTRGGVGNANGSGSGGVGGAFMRRHDGTLVFVDASAFGASAMRDFEELPFDDDDEDDLADEALSESMGEAAMILDNSAFGLFGEDRCADGRGSLKGPRASTRGSLRSDQLTMGTGTDKSQQQLNEDYEAEGVDLNGYRTAASFCFDEEKEDAEEAALAADDAVITNNTSVPPPTISKAMDAQNDSAVLDSAHPDKEEAKHQHEGKTTHGGSKSDLALMDVAPARRRSSIVTNRMSSLLRHARSSHVGPHNPTPPATSPVGSTTTLHPPNVRPARRSSYALGIPPALATEGASREHALGERETSAKASDPLMAEVDSGIRELFPDEESLAA